MISNNWHMIVRFYSKNYSDMRIQIRKMSEWSFQRKGLWNVSHVWIGVRNRGISTNIEIEKAQKQIVL